MRWRTSQRIKFTPHLWEKWLAAREPDEHTPRLLEGMQTFRTLLATRELTHEHLQTRRKG
ncbi:MAG: hypothetical protein JWO52_3480 [Gammaproteobacteria bacterium]|nr:hypothetical protein [Gammaproteobacteria bacterium]